MKNGLIQRYIFFGKKRSVIIERNRIEVIIYRNANVATVSNIVKRSALVLGADLVRVKTIARCVRTEYPLLWTREALTDFQVADVRTLLQTGGNRIGT